MDLDPHRVRLCDSRNVHADDRSNLSCTEDLAV